ncbi:MAG: cysteine desulfurase [Clostridia bacterium]|nr:cysteine desulfurase [Clostridia bacterium]
MKPIYMDHSATTPLSEGALNAMLPYMREQFGNPSAVYSYGQTAKNAVEKSRDRVAKAIGALRTEIFFTSGGTESDNWIIRSVARLKGRGHIITSAIEHNAVLRTLAQLEEDGYEVTYLAPDRLGQIAPEQLERAIRPDTILVSIMLANNVVGTVLNIRELAAVARRHRVLFHTDAVQAVGHIPVQVRSLGVDFLSISAHKFCGPKGVGAVFCRMPNKLPPLLTGGGQEKERRSGTENVPGIVGMAQALEEAVAALDCTVPRLNALRDRLIAGVTAIPGIALTGDPVRRLPGFASFTVSGVGHSVLLVNALNECGYCVSSGSACSASSKEASHVLLSLGYEQSEASSSLRITLGAENTEAEVDGVIEAIRRCVARLRTESVTRAPRLEGRVADYGAAGERAND